MSNTVQEHEGSKTIELTIGSDGRVRARIPAENKEVGEKDRFKLHPGDSLNMSWSVSPKPTKARCELFLWQEGATELPPSGKVLSAAKSVDAFYDNSGPGVSNGMVAGAPYFDGDLEVSLSALSAELKHVAGHTHAHYQFALKLTYDDKVAFWDPDVHDVGPG